MEVGGELVLVDTVSPSVMSTTIPVASVVAAVAMLVVAGVLMRTLVRHRGLPEALESPSPAVAETAAGTHVDASAPTLNYLLELGEALIDAGEPMNSVREILRTVARVNGLDYIGVVVLPTALFLSLPQGQGVQTEVVSAGRQSLRLDQIERLYRVVDLSRRQKMSPVPGIAALHAIRVSPSPFPSWVRILGHGLFVVGLVLILRGGWTEMGVAAVLGVVIGALHVTGSRVNQDYRAFLPLVSAFLVSSVVFTLAGSVSSLQVFPPLVAPLVAFLPGALLTTAVFELSTGQIVAGSARLASGGLRLVLLALGIIGGAQLVGVPAADISQPGGAGWAVAPWLGVLVFGVGVVLFKGARLGSLGWIVLVLYVGYAGQILGGVFFGSVLSAFLGALVMTPVAMVVARHPSGPPTQVTFLPGFWLLVPGAVGLEGVTRLLDQDQMEGVSTLTAMGTSMVGIALGVLAGLALGAQLVARPSSQPTS
ncbi:MULTISPECIES: threonine/serine exporter ThrE family protein [unclassified Ornithinimicrobium]|uniref:threonine/serine ThrE exporter family protein n=1 Tax=unclassified Ornithinimicrobium TaxID=2615080 RepID=UPI003851BF86